MRLIGNSCRHLNEHFCKQCTEELYELIESYKKTNRVLLADKNDLEKRRKYDLDAARTLVEGDDVAEIVVAVSYNVAKLQDKINNLQGELQQLKNNEHA